MLAATICYHLANVPESFSNTAQILGSCLRLDDFITGVSSIEEATKIYEDSQQVMSSAGMKLWKWGSNNESLWQRFDADGIGNPCADIATTTSAVTSVLELEWNRGNDELKCSLKTALELLMVSRNTKRFMLHASARILDPLGLLSPVTITAKLLFQELWPLGLEWDEKLPRGVSEKWEN